MLVMLMCKSMDMPNTYQLFFRFWRKVKGKKMCLHHIFKCHNVGLTDTDLSDLQNNTQIIMESEKCSTNERKIPDVITWLWNTLQILTVKERNKFLKLTTHYGSVYPIFSLH